MQASVQRVAVQSTCLSVSLVQSPALADDSGRKESQHERLSSLGLLGGSKLTLTCSFWFSSARRSYSALVDSACFFIAVTLARDSFSSGIGME